MKLYCCIFGSITQNNLKVFIALMLSASISVSYAQNAPQKATRQSALDAFSGGKYDMAYVQYSELSTLYPKDPLYKYYRGVCLVRLEREPEPAAKLLKESIRESAAIRSVPPDARFYLGRALQMSGHFAEAIQSYEDYSESAGKKAAKDMNVPEFIKQCEAGKGTIEAAAASKMEIVSGDSVVSVGEEATQEVVGKHEELPESYDKLLSEAIILQNRSDSAMAVAVKYRGDMEKAEGTARSSLWAKIQETEKQSFYYRSTADQKMAEAGKLAGISESVIQDTAPDPDPGKAAIVTAAATATDKSDITVTGQKADSSSATGKQVIVNPQPQVKEVFSEFIVTEKPVYKPGEKVVVNPQVPPGLIYRIQMAVFRNPVVPSYFKGISPINGFRNEVSGITTYYAGIFRKSADAAKALPRVKSLGFKDAYVIALMDKKTVSADRAAMLEKEWGVKPLYTIKTGPEPVRDTIPQTLVFRVEVKRSPKPLPKDQLEGVKKMAGTRGFDIIVTEKKQNIYIIGTFLTYKSASEYADLLIRNGYRDSKVVAYLGKREIPVETARKLFDEY